MFVDFGNNATVDVGKLIDLENAMPELVKIPPQVKNSVNTLKMRKGRDPFYFKFISKWPKTFLGAQQLAIYQYLLNRQSCAICTIYCPILM